MLKNYPLVTSIVLCYKKFNYLYDAISSILSQDYPRIEIIIADDASGNFPEREIRDFIDRNKKDNIIETKIIINEKNVGTVRNYNKAIKVGTGQYYIGLSGDDVFFDNTVMRRIVERFEETGYDMLCCRRLKCTEDRMEPVRMMPSNAYIPIIAKIDTVQKQYRAFVMGRYYEMASGSATYFSRRHFKQWGGFDESYTLWEDGPFYVQYTRLGNFIHTAYDIISIRYRAGGISEKSPSTLLMQDNIRFSKVECYQNKDSFNKIDQRYISFSYQRLLHCQNYSKSKSMLLYIRYFDVVIRKLYHKYFCLLINLYESEICKRDYRKR